MQEQGSGPLQPQSSKPDPTGLFSAIVAHSLFGMFPIYFKLVDDVLPLEVLAHRVFWSFILLALILFAMGRLKKALPIVTNPRMLGVLLLSAVLIAANWGLYIWAVGQERVLECSLGYYINPLFSVFLGVVFLHEKLSKLQWTAIALAATGVGIQVVLFGDIPWVALGLAFSFGLYGFVRKKLPHDALISLMIETALLTPVALILFAVFFADGSLAFGQPGGTSMTLILVSAGLVTTVPLLLFTRAAPLLPLSTLGIVQYITPTGQFLLAIFAYGEAFQFADGIVFGLIWLGLLIFTADRLRRGRRVPKLPVA